MSSRPHLKFLLVSSEFEMLFHTWSHFIRPIQSKTMKEIVNIIITTLDMLGLWLTDLYSFVLTFSNYNIF